PHLQPLRARHPNTPGGPPRPLTAGSTGGTHRRGEAARRPRQGERPPAPAAQDGPGRSGRALPFPAVMGPVPRGRALVDEGKELVEERGVDRKSTRLNSSHVKSSYAV